MDESLVSRLIEEESNRHLTLWFRELGIEYTIELIERCSILPVKEVYMNLLRNRGLTRQMEEQ